MPKCIIDGKEAEFNLGENMIEVARRVGITIPYFCYHPGLSVVAQCRMCAVEIEKMPKLQTACSTLPQEGMVIKTRSERAKDNQRAIMEFLLINHPLDCPICDKSGECDLQDHSYQYGDAYMRTTEERRTYMDLDMGPVIKKNMNRCIHCTRCIRFGEEVAGIHEMVAVKRGNNTEITTLDGRALETDYAGNYADICPTGSLTLKDFRFKKRVWFLKKTPSICEGCSRGCSLELHQDGNIIQRSVPRENKEINKYWLCDEGRFNFKYVNHRARVSTPLLSQKEVGWTDALVSAREALSRARQTVILLGTDLSNEEIKLAQEFFSSQLEGRVQFYHFGTPQIVSASQDGPEDEILKRKSKTANLHGMESFGVKPLDQSFVSCDALLVIRGGRAVLPKLPESAVRVGLGVFMKADAQQFNILLPGLSWAEKDGTFINYEGKTQKFNRAILPVGQAKALGEIFMLWKNAKNKIRESSIGAA